MATLHSDSLKSENLFNKYRNAFINGDFTYWNRGQSWNPYTGGYTADRWVVGEVTDGSIRIDKDANEVPSDSLSNPANSYKLEVLTADASLASSQYTYIVQKIEGYNYKKYIGKTATLSFWVRSSVTGAYTCSFRNNGTDRSYVSEITINQANTWEYKTVTLTFNSDGDWNTTSGIGLRFGLTLAGSTQYQTSSVDQWVTGNYITGPNQVNWMASAGNTFYLSQVQLELGSEATPFEKLSIQEVQYLCYRYYEIIYHYWTMVQTGTGYGYGWNMVEFEQKRAAPTVTYSGIHLWGRSFWRAVTNVNIYAVWHDRMRVYLYDTGSTGYSYGGTLSYGTYYLDAEL